MGFDKQIKILVVDDVKEWRKVYTKGIMDVIKDNRLDDLVSGICEARDGKEALRMVKEDPAINFVVTDLFMGPCCDGAVPENPDQPFGGVWLIRKITDTVKRPFVLLLVSDKEDAERYEMSLLLNKGYKNYDFVEKGNLDSLHGNSLEAIKKLLFAQVRSHKKQPEFIQPNTLGERNGVTFIGTSSKIVAMLNDAEKVATVDTNVFLIGESGTGKGTLAKFIHGRSARKDSPFVDLDCSVLPESLLEAELFGHVKGTFTGAVSDKPGLIEIANGGTLFLDEIGHMSEAIQKKLLKVLEERSFRKVGGTELLTSNFRLISATSTDPGKLYLPFLHRIAVFPIVIPPLRERKEDIPLLANFYLKLFQNEFNARPMIQEEFDTLVSECFQLNWNGNIRELINRIERYTVCDYDLNKFRIDPERLSISDLGSASETPRQTFGYEGKTYEEAKEEFDRSLFFCTLTQCQGDATKAAAMLNVGVSTVKNRMTLYRWSKQQFR